MEKLKKVGNVLAHGESGNTHRVQVQVMEREDGVRVFEGETEVAHEEHGVITLPKKKWNSAPVVEIDHLEQVERQVRD